MNFRIFSFGLFLFLGLSNSSKAQVDCDANVPTDLFIPNVITPNGDAKNDEFRVISGKLTKLHVEIFDRWGIKVYTMDGVNSIWDGTAYGSVQSAGTYYYSVEYSSTCAPSLVLKTGGYFTLLRSN
ncbi:MAG: gliding motility-associated C-terminal domain-containing protein [Bacteroidetes bacterium]|nr:gliding motility-associated C-terminal domain-containing protein [Bacteroidota bacterium]